MKSKNNFQKAKIKTPIKQQQAGQKLNTDYQPDKA